jgi:large subunit ribosomal protein L24
MKIRKNDIVLILSGKDRGKKGKVIESFPKESRIVVEGLNLRKKHVRAKKSGEKGQIVSLPASINVSNVKIICGKCGKAARIGVKAEGGKKYRICKKCKQEI